MQAAESARRAQAHSLQLERVMKRATICGIVALSLASGCTLLGDTSSSVEGGDDTDEGGDDTNGAIDRDECKIEGGQLGQEGAILRLGPKTVTFHDWVLKTGEGEYVGFSISVSGASSVGYVVKTGGERWPSTATTWLHPAGPDGMSDAPAISNIDFCEECEDGSCDGGGGDGGGDCPEPGGCDDGGGGGECTEPDGCDGGGDGDGTIT